MSTTELILKELVHLRDELKLKTHLLGMELRDEWEVLDKKIRHFEDQLEHDFITLSQKIGRAEEEFFVGDEQEIESFIEDLKALQKKSEQEKK